MTNYNIENFDDFITGCEGILINAQFDLIEWKGNFNPEKAYKLHLDKLLLMKVKPEEAKRQALERKQAVQNMADEGKANWEQRSFYGCGEMQTAQKAWDKFKDGIYENAHLSKYNLKGLILVEGNTDVKNYVQNKLATMYRSLEDFSRAYYVDNLKNEWFMQLIRYGDSYKQWFEETFVVNAERDKNKFNKVLEMSQQKEKEQARKKNGENILTLPDIGLHCYYNNRTVNITNDIAIAKEFGIETDRHTINKWYIKAEKNDFSPGVISGRMASAHIKRLEKILNSDKLNSTAVSKVRKDIQALKTVISTEQ